MGGVAAESVDLGPAGHAGAGDVAGHVVADPVLELIDEMGAFGAGADEGHVANEDVPELGKFVEVPFAEEFADAGAAGVVGGGPDGAGFAFGVDGHGAQFEDGEGLAGDAAAFLAVENGAGGAALDEGGGEEDDRGGNEQADEGAGEVLEALENAVPEGVEGPGGHADERDVGDMVDMDARGEHAVEVGDHAEGDQVALAMEQNLGEALVGDGGVGQDDFVDLFVGNDLFQFADVALDELGGDGGREGDFASAGIDGEEVAGEARAQARFAFEGAADAGGEVVDADDEDAADGGGAAGPVQLAAEEDEPLDQHQQQHGEERQQGHGTRIGRPVRGADNEREGQGGGEGDGDAADDARQLVAEGPELRADIQADLAEDQHQQGGQGGGGRQIHDPRGQDFVVMQGNQPGVEADPRGQHHAGKGCGRIGESGQDAAQRVEIVPWGLHEVGRTIRNAWAWGQSKSGIRRQGQETGGEGAEVGGRGGTGGRGGIA
jgi:hypothetical protein